MTPTLLVCLRLAGAGLILLALLHAPIARRLQWRADAARMSQLNATVFHVHNLFICFVLVAMGVPCLVDPHVLLEDSRAAAWGTGALTAFWTVRLWCQWLVYRPSLWRGKPLETAIHWWCSFVWLFLVAVFGLCAARHAGFWS